MFLFLAILLVACGSSEAKLDLDPDEEAVVIYVVDHGRHAGIIIPVNDKTLNTLPSNLGLSGTQYFEIGWGDLTYYTGKSQTLGASARAVLWPTNSVLHIVRLNRHPEEFFSGLEIKSIEIASEGFERLLNRINDSFELNDENEIIRIASGLYGNSDFYASNESYYFPRTSNFWIAELLTEAGYPVSPIRAITSSGLMNQIE